MYSSEIRPSQPITITTYPNGLREVDMSLEQFEVINEVTRSEYGETLFDIAENNPHKACKLIKVLLTAVVNRNGHLRSVSVNGILAGDTASDTEDTLKTMGCVLINGIVDNYGSTPNLSVGVYTDETDEQLFATKPERIPLLDINIDSSQKGTSVV